MSNKLMLTKFALSTALLVSIVANPATSDAANKTNHTNNAQFQIFQKTISSNSVEGPQFFAFANAFNNPLDVAKKYAPDTVEDWTKTLALYEKKFGAIQSNVVSTLEAVNATLEGVQGNLDGSDIIELTSTPMSNSTIVGDISTDEVVSLDGTISLLSADSVSFTESVSFSDSVSSIKMGKAEIMTDDANDPHLAFFNAQIELEKAVESKDTAAIKKSLAQLLEQYKVQIEQSESEQ